MAATLALPLFETARRNQRGSYKRCGESGIGKEPACLCTPAFLDQLKAVMAQAEQGYAQNTTTLLLYLDARRTYFHTLADYYDPLAKARDRQRLLTLHDRRRWLG